MLCDLHFFYILLLSVDLTSFVIVVIIDITVTMNYHYCFAWTQVKGEKPPAPVRGLRKAGASSADDVDGDGDEAEVDSGVGGGSDVMNVADLLPRNDIRSERTHICSSTIKNMKPLLYHGIVVSLDCVVNALVNAHLMKCGARLHSLCAY